jgi:hypothetical protein
MLGRIAIRPQHTPTHTVIRNYWNIIKSSKLFYTFAKLLQE